MPTATTHARSLIGITVDNRDNTAASGRYELATAYPQAVAAAGGVPVLLPHEPEMVEHFIQACQGFIFTGGVDPRTEQFNQTTHPSARPMDPRRQQFELALLESLDHHRDIPVLGICLGMQLMALHAGAHLHQHLPDFLPTHKSHQDNNRHLVALLATDSVLSPASGSNPDDLSVVSWHRQAVAISTPTTTAQPRAGKLRVVATAPDGVVEAIDDPSRLFYLGVQWHPERGGPGPLNQGLIDRLMLAARHATSSKP